MKKKVLVVDDSAVVLKFMTRLLSSRGHHVETAQDGLSALDILKKFTPDVLFIDLIMPNIDGEKLCRIVRNMPGLGDTYIVMFSSVEPEEKTDLSLLGADAYIAKGDFKQAAQQILSILELSGDKSVRDLPETLPDADLFISREVSRELLTTKKHLETILGSVSEGVLEINEQHRVVFVNPAAASLIGIPEDGLLGTSVVNLFEQSDRKKVNSLLESVKAVDDKVSGEVVLARSGKPVILSFVPFKIIGSDAILILNDVSERKQAEAARQESENTYQSLFENAPVGLWEAECSALGDFFDELRTQGVTDLGGYLRDHPQDLAKCSKMIKILNVNKTAVETYGARNKEELLKNIDNFAALKPLSQVKGAIINLAKGNTSFEGMSVSQTLTGESKNFLVRWTLVPGLESKLSRMLISLLDLTERMHAERKTEKAKEEAEAARQELKRINEQLEKANKDLQKLTLIDGLTGIANRRYFDQVLNEEWRRAMRNNEPMSFILGDIDHFKLFNDYYGHQEGDECLRQIAETLNRLARRPGDLVARYGGEEFGIILARTSAEDAYLLAEKARMAVLDLRIPHKPSDVSEFVTISLGVTTTVPERISFPQKLIEGADRALYRAKSGGRNQVQRERNPHPETTAVPGIQYRQ